MDAAEIPQEVLAAAEAAAEVVHTPPFADHYGVGDGEQAKSMPLRKPPAVKGDIRLVKIDGVDLNACGGTHPKNTSDIGLIKIISVEKAKGGTRVYFLCGGRAFGHFKLLIETTDELVRQLNSPLKDLPGAADALLEEKTAIEKELKDTRSKLLEAESLGIQSAANTATAERIFYNRPIKRTPAIGAYSCSARKRFIHTPFIGRRQRRTICLCKRGRGTGRYAGGAWRVAGIDGRQRRRKSGIRTRRREHGECENEQFIRTFQKTVKKFRENL